MLTMQSLTFEPTVNSEKFQLKFKNMQVIGA